MLRRCLTDSGGRAATRQGQGPAGVGVPLRAKQHARRGNLRAVQDFLNLVGWKAPDDGQDVGADVRVAIG